MALLEAALAEGDLEEAITAARKLVNPDLQPSPRNAIEPLCAACDEHDQGRHAEAAATLERAIEIAGRLAVA